LLTRRVALEDGQQQSRRERRGKELWRRLYCFQNNAADFLGDGPSDGLSVNPRVGLKGRSHVNQLLLSQDVGDLTVMELGGSDAFIVCEDADLPRAVAAGIKGRFSNAGQVCLAAKRFILVGKIADEFE
jgi:hypothetical protein